MSDDEERFEKAWVITDDRILCVKGDLWRERDWLMFYRDRRLTGAAPGQWGRTLVDAQKALLAHMDAQALALRTAAATYENRAARLRESIRKHFG